MTKAQFDRLFGQVTDIADRLGAGDDSLSSNEVTELLSCAGYYDEALRQGLRSALNEIAVGLRRSVHLLPRYLSRVMDGLSPVEVLATKQPAVARLRVRQILKTIADAAERPISLSEGRISVVHAYRKSG